MAPFDATNFDGEIANATVVEFQPVNAIILDPIFPDGEERARLFAHPNAVSVWEGRYHAA